MSDLASDFALAEAAVREAGTLARAHFSASPAHWSKADSSPVSEADHAVDRLLGARLRGPRPGHGWICEESLEATAREGHERIWVVDPIDGTRAYLNGADTWVISVALVVGDQPAFGFLYNPLREEFFAAMRGQGASLNGKPISVGSRADIAGCRMLANPSRFAPERWAEPWPAMEIDRVRSSAYQVGLVAAGMADATIAFTRIHEWDLAAAHIILTEAGGTITGPHAEHLSYNQPELRHAGAVAANPALHGALIDFIAHNRQNDAGGPGRRG